jgi:hypothetical protein
MVPFVLKQIHNLIERLDEIRLNEALHTVYPFVEKALSKYLLYQRE